MIETLRVIHESSIVVFEIPLTQFLSGPPDDPASNHSSRWVDGSYPVLYVSKKKLAN
jgi:hypothetical protein